MKALSGGGHVEVGGNNTPGPPHDAGNTKSSTLANITAQGTQTQAIAQIQDQGQAAAAAAAGNAYGACADLTRHLYRLPK